MDNQASNAPINERRPRRKFPVGGLIILIVGILWLLNNLGFSWAGNIWVPLIVIVVGLTIIIRR